MKNKTTLSSSKALRSNGQNPCSQAVIIPTKHGSNETKARMESVELGEATDFRAGDTVYQVGSKLKGTVQHKGNRDLIAVKFGSINQMIPASKLRLAEETELDEAAPKLKGNNGPYTRQQIEKAAKEAKVDIGAKARMMMALRNL